MSNNKFEDSLPMKVLVPQIWRMFDVLKNSSIGINEYHIILLFLSLYKDNQISRDFLFGDNLKDLEVSQIKLKNEENPYFNLFKSFQSSLLELRNKGFEELIDALYRIDKELLTDNFSEIFEYTLYQITQSQGRIGGEFIQPLELTRFICALADLPEKSKVFNPFAGLASFGVCLDQGQDYYGQEINQKTWSIGFLRMMAHGKTYSDKYVKGNSFTDWPRSSEKYGLIVAHPPLGMRLNRAADHLETDARTAEEFLLKEGVKSLSDKGKLMAIVSQGFLFRGGSEGRLREQLIEDDLIDTVVSIPGGLLSNTGIPIVLLVLDKNKLRTGVVRFIQAEKYVSSKNAREKLLDYQELLNAIVSASPDPEVIRLIENNQIKELRYNLSVNRYFQKKVDGVKLKNLLKYVRGQHGEFPKESKLIKIKDLKSDNLDYTLDPSKVERHDRLNRSLRSIKESCLLLASRGKTLKPTFFKYSGDAILLTEGVQSFLVDEKAVDIPYLINELQADYVQEQLDSFRLGVTIPMIRRDDLFEVVIKLPPILEQKAKIQGILEVSKRIEMLQKERNALAHGKASSDFNEFASLKHTLGRPRQNILDWSDNLHHFFSSNPEGFEKLNNDFLSFYDTDILSALKEINRDVNFMTKVLEKGENGFQVEDFEKNLISLTEVNNMVVNLSENGLKFKIKRQRAKGQDLKTRGIYGSRVLLQTLFDNLLTNANKYGFEAKKDGNEVVIELKAIDDFLSVEIRNNGKPFPENYDRESFITKYSTADSSAGTGLGGYDIHRIAKEFENPDWGLVLNEDPIYPIKFQFQFPIKLVK